MLALCCPAPEARAAAVTFAEVAVQHTGVEVQEVPGIGHVPFEVPWDRVQPGADVGQWTSYRRLNYTSNIDTRLTMQHQATATASIFQGTLQFGREPRGPALRVATEDVFEFNGEPLSPGVGATWARSVAELDASARIGFDLSILASAALPQRLTFWWQLDGTVGHHLFAPTPPLGSGEDNFFTVGAPVLQSRLRFVYGQQAPGCLLCLDFHSHSFGFDDYTALGSNGQRAYDYTGVLPPTIIPVTFDVTQPVMTDLFFGLFLSSDHELKNEEYANTLLTGTLSALFDNSLTLLGIEALDADGRTMTGVSFRASEADLVLPVWGGGSGTVPEPAGPALAGIALAGLALARRRAQRAAAPAPAAAEPAA